MLQSWVRDGLQVSLQLAASSLGKKGRPQNLEAVLGSSGSTHLVYLLFALPAFEKATRSLVSRWHKLHSPTAPHKWGVESSKSPASMLRTSTSSELNRPSITLSLRVEEATELASISLVGAAELANEGWSLFELLYQHSRESCMCMLHSQTVDKQMCVLARNVSTARRQALLKLSILNNT